MKTVKIGLEGLVFFTYHGVFEAEQKIGNRYTVDLELEAAVSATALQEDQLEGTIDYGAIYQVVQSVMQQPSKLLEYLAEQINQKCLQQFPAISRITTSVAKHNPPIAGLCQQAKVSITQSRD